MSALYAAHAPRSTTGSPLKQNRPSLEASVSAGILEYDAFGPVVGASHVDLAQVVVARAENQAEYEMGQQPHQGEVRQRRRAGESDG